MVINNYFIIDGIIGLIWGFSNFGWLCNNYLLCQKCGQAVRQSTTFLLLSHIPIQCAV